MQASALESCPKADDYHPSVTLPSVPEEPKSGAIKILLDRLFPERKREQAELKRQIAARVETSL